MSAKSELFISYHRESAMALVQELIAFLEKRFPFIKVTTDDKEIKTGDSIRAYMDRLTKGEYIIFVLDDGFLESEYCMYELALTKNHPEFKQRLFQLRFPGFKAKTNTDFHVGTIVEAWQTKWVLLRDLHKRIEAQDPDDVSEEMKDGQRIAKAIVQGIGKVLPHIRDAKGIEVNVKGTLEWEILERDLRSWIKLPVPIQKLQADMVQVEGGTFQMGNDTSVYGDEKPAHAVKLSSFAMSKYQITQAQWCAVMGTNPSYFKGDGNLPVENVSWDDCQTFIFRLNTATEQKYRLPTEAEWEYAARGGTRKSKEGFQYSGSNDLNEVAWNWENADGKTHPVGLKKPNELGLYDMSGNVWEWCQDVYDKDYYKQFENKTAKNPINTNNISVRVLRGGSWGFSAVNCRVSNRDYVTPASRNLDVGFRVSRD